MHRFFADENGVVNGAAALDALDAQHAVRVLRLTAGDEVELMDAGRRYAAAIEAAGPDGVRVRITRVLPSTEPRVRVTLFQGLPKAEKMELIVQKCTELGVYEVQPVAMERCVAQIKDKDAEKKRERWQKIAREAAKQCGRAQVPQVHAPATLAQLAQALSGMDLLMVPWEDARDGSIRNALEKLPEGAARIGIVIGPEGGMSEKEARCLEDFGGKLVTLGARILRTETAGMAALTLTLGFLGEME